MSAVHAREYATAELNTRFAEYLIDNYGTNADATWLLDHHEFHFLLQSNPDGRKQAETGPELAAKCEQQLLTTIAITRGQT